VLGEGHEPRRDEIAGGLVAGHEQLHEEHGELGVAQLVAVQRSLGQLGEHVVARVVATGLGRAHQVVDHLGQKRLAALLGPVGGAGHDRLGPLVAALPFVLGDAEHLADHEQRQRHGQLGHDVHHLAGLDAGHERLGPGPHHRVEGPHHRGLETRLDEAPVARVGGRVGVEDGGRCLVGGADLVHEDALRCAEGLVVALHVADVGVLGHHPEAALLVPGHGRLGAQAGEERMWIGLVARRIEHLAGQVRAGPGRDHGGHRGCRVPSGR
jgi:hypothetical protein